MIKEQGNLVTNTIASPPITFDQYLHFKAPSGFRDELILGEIVLSPDPKAVHQETAHQICHLLEQALKGSNFVARQRTNMQMPQDHSMPSPDVFVIDTDRWLAAIAHKGYPQQSPQLVVEVISRSNTRKNVTRKTALYLKNGASAVWIVYPQKQIVQVVDTAGQHATFVRADHLQLPAPLPESRLAVDDFFRLPVGGTA